MNINIFNPVKNKANDTTENTGDADVAAALEAVDSKEEPKDPAFEAFEKNFWSTFNEIKELEKKIADREHAEFIERITPKDDGGLKRLKALISELEEKGTIISSQEMTKLQVEEAARISKMFDAIEKAYGPIENPFTKIIAFIPNDEEKKSFEEARARAYKEVTGVSEDFAKAKEAALKDINSPEAKAAFDKAREDALSYVDKISGKETARLASEKVHSAEFLIAMNEIKNMAKSRIDEIIADLNKPTVEEMAEDRKKEFDFRINEIKQEIENRFQAV